MTPGQWLSAAGTVCARELHKLCNSPAEIVICWIMPFVWMMVAWGLLGDGIMQKLPVALVDLDNSPMSRQIAFDMSSLRSVDFISFADTSSAMNAMKKGDAYGVVVIPHNYSRDVTSGQGQSIVLYLDQTRYAVAGTLKADMAAYMSNLSKTRLESASFHAGGGVAGANRRLDILEADFYSLGNPASSFLAFLGSNLLPGILQLCAALAFNAALIREVYNRTVFEWLYTAKFSLSAALMGKFTPSLIVFFGAVVWYVALFLAQGGMIADGSIMLWCIAGFLMVLGMLGAILLFFSACPTWRLSIVLTCGYAAPALPFGGFSIPLDSMGPYVQNFAKILPITWFEKIQGQQWVLGSNFDECLFYFIYMALIATVPLVLGFFVLRFRFRRLGISHLSEFMKGGK